MRGAGLPVTGQALRRCRSLQAVFERFSDRSRAVLVHAEEQARLLGHGFIGAEHLLLGLSCEDAGVAARVLASLGVSLDAASEAVRRTAGKTDFSLRGSPPFTPRAKKVLELSLRETLDLGDGEIGSPTSCWAWFARARGSVSGSSPRWGQSPPGCAPKR